MSLPRDTRRGQVLIFLPGDCGLPEHNALFRTERRSSSKMPGELQRHRSSSAACDGRRGGGEHAGKRDEAGRPTGGCECGMTVRPAPSGKERPAREAPALAEFEGASDRTCLRVPRRKSGPRRPPRLSRFQLSPLLSSSQYVVRRQAQGQQSQEGCSVHRHGRRYVLPTRAWTCQRARTLLLRAPTSASPAHTSANNVSNMQAPLVPAARPS